MDEGSLPMGLACGIIYGMMTKRYKIIYWMATSLLCLVVLYSSLMYLLRYEMVSGFYIALGFPVWMIYPSAFAKLLAVLAILSKRSKFLKEWAYAGLFFDVSMALAAHRMAGDGGGGFALVAILSLGISYMMDGKLYGNAGFPHPLRDRADH